MQQPAVGAPGALDAARVRELLRNAAARLAAITDTPRLEAELLLAHASGLSREQLLMGNNVDPNSATADAEGAQIEVRFNELMVQRILSRRPIAYITGTRQFRRIALKCDQRALIPRPETELLVEACLELAPGSSVLDVGTGTGAIALALKDERADLRITGSDISSEALALAGENRTLLELDIELVCADLLIGLPREYAAVVCNAPYVAAAESALLAPEITEYEPSQALYAGSDGLEVIGRLAAQLADRPEIAFAALEVGAGQAPEVAGMLGASGFQQVRKVCDLAGIERVVTAQGRV